MNSKTDGTQSSPNSASDRDEHTTQNEKPILRAEGLTKHYDSSTGLLDTLLGRSKAVRALDGVDLELYEGETLGIVGESGCGKTTLGRALLRLLEPTDGSVYYRPRSGDGSQGASDPQTDDSQRVSDPQTDDGSQREIELTSVSKRRLRELRTDLQYVFQDPFSSLNPRLTVAEIVGEPLAIHGIASGRARTERIHELLELVGLNPAHATRYPGEFSGGQRQRIGIARALAVDPEIIVCDEPVSALDVSVQAQILTLLEALQEDLGLSYVFIGHDLRVVEHVADRVAVLYLGEVVETGPTEAVFEPPHHPYVEALLSAIPEPDPLWEGDRIRLPGTVPSPIDPPEGCRFHPRCPRIISPSDVEIGQDTWDAMRAFKTRLDTASSVESVLDERNSEPLSRNDLDELVRRTFGMPNPIADSEADERFSTVVGRLAEDGPSAAADAFEAAFPSPCQKRDPELRPVGEDHEIACLLYDDTE